MPDVVSVGIGLNSEGQQAIIFGLKARNPQTEANIPFTLDGYPVMIPIVGPMTMQKTTIDCRGAATGSLVPSPS